MELPAVPVPVEIPRLHLQNEDRSVQNVRFLELVTLCVAAL